MKALPCSARVFQGDLEANIQPADRSKESRGSQGRILWVTTGSDAHNFQSYFTGPNSANGYT